jgi:hypothetical protein
MKSKELSQDELSFLFEKIKRGTIVTEKERINLNELNGLYDSPKAIPDRHVPFGQPVYLKYKNEDNNTKNSEAIRQRIAKLLIDEAEFEVECNGDDYDYYGDAILVVYNSRPETYDEYMNRLYFYGREMIRKEKAKQKRNSIKEKRKVLFEKTKKKKTGRPKKDIPIPVVANNFLDFGIIPRYYIEDPPF